MAAACTLMLVACFPKEQEQLIATGREQGGLTQVQAALTQAALAQQTYQATTGTYATDVNALVQEAGLRLPAGVMLVVRRADDSGYCMEATQPNVATPYHLETSGGAPVEGPC